MDRVVLIRNEVESLYRGSANECMRTWFYDNHVRVVENYGTEIAPEAGANAEIVALSALFHDLARVWDVQEEPFIMDRSLEAAGEIMKRHGYSPEEIQAVKDAIIPHSCRDGMKPYTEEGKVLATADALAHLMTDFYLALWKNHWVAGNMTFGQYAAWALKKIDRDFHEKIFYDKWRKNAERSYNGLKSDFAQFFVEWG